MPFFVDARRVNWETAGLGGFSVVSQEQSERWVGGRAREGREKGDVG